MIADSRVCRSLSRASRRTVGLCAASTVHVDSSVGRGQKTRPDPTSYILWLLAAFRKRLDRPTWFSRELAPSTYAAFVLHPPMVVGVGLMLRSVGLPPIPKLLVAGFVGLAVCFAVAGLVRRLPLVRRVVG